MTTSPQSNPSMFSLDGITYILFRRKWLILLGLILGIGCAGAVYFLSPATYVSEAKLLVRYVTDNTSMDMGSEDGRVMRPDSRGGNILNSEAAIARSRNLAAAVVRDLGATTIFPPKAGNPPLSEEAAAAAILKNLVITIPRQSNIIQLAYYGTSPQVAQQVLERMIDKYLQRHHEIHSAAASYGFFSQKTDQLRADLRATEAELQQLKQEVGVVDVDESRTLLVAHLDQIRQGIDQQNGLIASAEARGQLFQEQLGTLPAQDAAIEPAEAAVPDPATDRERQQVQNQLALLRDREFDLLTKYTPDSAPVQGVQLQIEEAERRALALGVAAPERPILLGSDAESDIQKELILQRSQIVSSQALVKLLLNQREAVEQEINRLNQNESRIVELERQRAIQDSAYRRFADSLDSAKNQLALAPDQLSNITEVEPATLPLVAVKPEKIRKLAMSAGAAGLGFGCGLALLLELLGGRSLRRTTDIERVLDVPTLITLPFSRVFRRPVEVADESRLLAAGDQAGDAKAAAPSEPRRIVAGPLAAYFEALHHRIQTTGVFEGEIPHLIGVASCGSGSGTTTIAGGLAVTLSSHEEEKVLLIDGNLGGGTTHRMLGINEGTSLPQVLINGQGQTSRVQNGLYLLSAGNGEHKLVRPSLGRRFRDLVGFLKDGNYTSVVMDLPPVTETSPTLQMAGLLDGIVLVVESEKTSRERARKALKLLKESNANVVGVVFNKKREYVPGWLDGSE